MEGADSGVALGAGSNKISRTTCSKFGSAISSGGGGHGCGQLGGGSTALPVAAQPESISAQASNNSVVFVLRILHFPGEDQTDAGERFVLFALTLAGAYLELGALVDDLGGDGVALRAGLVTLRGQCAHRKHEQQVGNHGCEQRGAEHGAGHQIRPSHSLRSAAARRTSPRTRWPPA